MRSLLCSLSSYLFNRITVHDCGRYPLLEQGNPYCHCWHKAVMRWLRYHVDGLAR